MPHTFEVTNDEMLEAIEKGLEENGYTVQKLGRKTANITKDGQTLKVAFRTSRDRYVGSGTSGALHRADIAAFVIGAVDSYERPTKIEVFLIPRIEILRRWEDRRAGRQAAGYAVGNGPTFLALNRLPGNEGLGSGLAQDFGPIATFEIERRHADQPSLADDVRVITGLDRPADIGGVDRFKREVADSAERLLRFDPVRVKIDIHITIDI